MRPHSLAWFSQQPGRLFLRSVLLAALVQLCLFAYASGPGLSGTSDSVYYLHAAGTLRRLGQLLHPDGTPYRYWPPLYPLLVSACGSLPAVRLLHGAALLGSLLLWSCLGHRLLPRTGAVLLPWLLALSTPWVVVSKFVWGETVFIALFAGYAAALYQWLHGRRRRWLLAATGLAVLLPMQRTIGLFLLAGIGTGLLLWALRHRRWLPGVLLQLGLGGLAGVAWQYYALLLAAPSVYALNRGWPQFMKSTADYGYVLARWLLPLRAGWRLEVAWWVWALVLLGLLLALWPRLRRSGTALKAAATPQAVPNPQALFARLLWAALLSFVGLMLVASIASRSASGPHDSERYASVLYAPVLLLALRAGPGLMNSWPLLWRLLLGLLLGYSAVRAGSNAAMLRAKAVVSWERDTAARP